MKIKSLLFLLFVSVLSYAQPVLEDKGKVFVCTPCGYACDSASYKGPGVCSYCGMEYVEKSTIRTKNISFDEMCNRIKSNENVVLLDVRTTEEFTGKNAPVPTFGHFKNALNINVYDLPTKLEELELYKDKEVIVYCSHSHRSPRASYFLSTNGFSNVANVVGGVSILSQEFGDNGCLKEVFVKHEK